MNIYPIDLFDWLLLFYMSWIKYTINLDFILLKHNRYRILMDTNYDIKFRLTLILAVEVIHCKKNTSWQDARCMPQLSELLNIFLRDLWFSIKNIKSVLMVHKNWRFNSKGIQSIKIWLIIISIDHERDELMNIYMMISNQDQINT